MGKSNKIRNTVKVNRDRFIESIYHLIVYGNTIRCFKDLLLSVGNKVSENERMIIRYSIHSNVMLMTTSFIDELNKYFLLYKSLDIETKNRIEAYKKIIEPIL